MKPGIAGLECADGFVAVDRAVVPDHDHAAAQMAKQIPKERADLRVLDVLGEEQEVEAVVPAAGLTKRPEMTEMRSRRGRWRSSGVWPRAAQVRRKLGIRSKPDSSTKTRWAPSREAFFDARPDLTLPVLDALLVALQRPALGLLHAPAQAVQQTAYVRTVIADAELSEDYPGRCLMASDYAAMVGLGINEPPGAAFVSHGTYAARGEASGWPSELGTAMAG